MNNQSALTQTEGTGIRASFSKIALAEVVDTNGRQSLLWASMERAIAFCKSSTERKAPCRIRRRVMAEKKPSTASSQEADAAAAHV